MSTKKHRPSLPPRRTGKVGAATNQAASAPHGAPWQHQKAGSSTAKAKGGSYWIYGHHAVAAALANPQRQVARILTAGDAVALPRPLPTPETVDMKEISRVAGEGAVHQGIAALVHPLDGYVLEDVLYNEHGPLVMLDQVSDPHNVGAILRSAAAFGAVAIIMPKDHSAAETAVMAKAASGALDIVKLVTVTNLAAALRDLKENGWWIVGLDGSATTLLTELTPDAKTVLVLGAEGKGMRRLTAESCDFITKLPMDNRMESLNVSNAAAIALYTLYTRGQ